MMRYSVRSLLMVTGIMAVVCFAYMRAEIVTGALIWLNIALMLTAVLYLVAGRDYQRPFCVGFLLCGVIYPCFPGPIIVRAVASFQSIQKGFVVSYVIGLALMIASGFLLAGKFRRR